MKLPYENIRTICHHRSTPVSLVVGTLDTEIIDLTFDVVKLPYYFLGITYMPYIYDSGALGVYFNFNDPRIMSYAIVQTLTDTDIVGDDAGANFAATFKRHYVGAFYPMFDYNWKDTPVRISSNTIRLYLNVVVQDYTAIANIYWKWACRISLGFVSDEEPRIPKIFEQ